MVSGTLLGGTYKGFQEKVSFLKLGPKISTV